MPETNKSFSKKPTSAFSLYVKLYCMKRTGKTKSHSITEATKTWLALSNEEKEIFYRKYNEYCENVRKSYANKLKNSEPFLKPKKKRESNMQNTVIEDFNCSKQEREVQSPASSMRTLVLEPQDDLWESNMQNTVIEDFNCSKQEREVQSPASSMHTLVLEPQDDLWERNMQNIVIEDFNCSKQEREVQSPASSMCTLVLEPQDDLCSNADQNQESPKRLEVSQRDIYEDSNMPQIRLPEPIEPTIRTAKDLFDIVSTLHEGITSSWASLSVLQKRRYQSAVLALKKDYIAKYKNYLESLPSEELFEHYCSKTSECI